MYQLHRMEVRSLQPQSIWAGWEEQILEGFMTYSWENRFVHCSSWTQLQAGLKGFRCGKCRSRDSRIFAQDANVSFLFLSQLLSSFFLPQLIWGGGERRETELWCHLAAHQSENTKSKWLKMKRTPFVDCCISFQVHWQIKCSWSVNSGMLSIRRGHLKQVPGRGTCHFIRYMEESKLWEILTLQTRRLIKGKIFTAQARMK